MFHGHRVKYCETKPCMIGWRLQKRYNIAFLVVLIAFLRIFLAELQFAAQHRASNHELRSLQFRSNETVRTETDLWLPPRIYRLWPNDRPLPCYSAERHWYTQKIQHSPSDTGFLYVKPFKAASSTLAGVNLRIARNVAQRYNVSGNLCRSRFSHGPQPFPAVAVVAKRASHRSFLWTALREPSARAVSQFFHFQVSKRQKQPTASNFQEFLVTRDPQGKKDYYLQTLCPFRRFNRDRHDPIKTMREILQEYDFIGITERLDESLIVLMMLLRLPMADILYVSAKTSGSYEAHDVNSECTYIQPSKVSLGMMDALSSKLWNDLVQYDNALYRSANQSLDKTIDFLGRTLVEEELARFRQAKMEVQRRCHPKLPCDENGHRQDADCLWKDSGCGMSCLDEVATSLNLW